MPCKKKSKTEKGLDELRSSRSSVNMRKGLKYLVFLIKGRVGKFEKPAQDTLFVIFHGMLLTSR